MSALQKLQEKIEQWRRDHEEIKRQNADLKSQLAGVAGAQEAQQALKVELESKHNLCTTHEESISALKQELQEKDDEIEKIIAQVESLLS
jgi:predicted RNase H-like nuclease (RuvC/YqgF family)